LKKSKRFVNILISEDGDHFYEEIVFLLLTSLGFEFEAGRSGRSRFIGLAQKW
jgi:hypothetical protein